MEMGFNLACASLGESLQTSEGTQHRHSQLHMLRGNGWCPLLGQLWTDLVKQTSHMPFNPVIVKRLLPLHGEPRQ